MNKPMTIRPPEAIRKIIIEEAKRNGMTVNQWHTMHFWQWSKEQKLAIDDLAEGEDRAE